MTQTAYVTSARTAFAEPLDFNKVTPPIHVYRLQRLLELLCADMMAYNVPCRARDRRVLGLPTSVKHHDEKGYTYAPVRAQYFGIAVLYYHGNGIFECGTKCDLFLAACEMFYRRLLSQNTIDSLLVVHPDDWLNNAARTVAVARPQLRAALLPRLVRDLCAIVEAYVLIEPGTFVQIVLAHAPPPPSPRRYY